MPGKSSSPRASTKETATPIGHSKYVDNTNGATMPTVKLTNGDPNAATFGLDPVNISLVNGVGTATITYVTQISYLLFLKMLEEMDTEQADNGNARRQSIFTEVKIDGDKVDCPRHLECDLNRRRLACLPELTLQQFMHSQTSAKVVIVIVWLCRSQTADASSGAISP